MAASRAPPPPPGGGVKPGGGVLRSGLVSALKMPVAPPGGATLSAVVAVPARRGVDGDPIPLACQPLKHAPHPPPPELNASPHEAVSKGFSGLLRRGVLLVGLLGTSSRLCVPSGIC